MRIGIVGAGTMGQVHAQAWLEAGAQVVAVHSASLESALGLAAQYGARVCSSLAELLEHVDVVDLCVPTHLHHAMTLEAANAGKHVVCEKPMALELSDARAMIEACEKSGVRLFIAHVVRFFPQYRAARDAVQSGQIGSLGVMRLKRTAYQPQVSGENWFLDSTKSGGMVLDLVKNGQIQFIINTPSGKTPRQDEVKIRTAALTERIPIMTTVRAAFASAEGIRSLQKGGMTVKSLQEYHGREMGKMSSK